MTVSWTPERVQRLRELWDAGLSAGQCAARLGGVTRNAVISKVHRTGLALRRSDKQSVRRATVLRKPREHRAKAAPPYSAQINVAVPSTPRTLTADECGAVGAVLSRMRGRCAWPVGDPYAADFHFCGEATQRTYCPQHHAIAYVKHERKVK
jgi:GcrA cell cycle regulator